MKINELQKVGEIVAEDYRTAEVFKKYGIDFCCGGGVSVAEACKDHGADAGELMGELAKIIGGGAEGKPDYNEKTLADLADLIVSRHHAYVEANIPVLKEYLQKIARVHGGNHPELNIVLALFLESADDLIKHIKKEELTLFPYIKNMETADKTGTVPNRPYYGSVNNSIAVMLEEHENEGERFSQIQAITNDYAFPEDACNTYKVAFHKLKEFQNDLHLHIHLENNILFPKAAELEKKLFGQK